MLTIDDLKAGDRVGLHMPSRGFGRKARGTVVQVRPQGRETVLVVWDDSTHGPWEIQPGMLRHTPDATFDPRCRRPHA